MLTLIPTGGLCNRMRAIASAYALSRKLNRKLTVIWIVNGQLGADYYSLFNPTELYCVVNLYPQRSLLERLKMYRYVPPRFFPLNRIFTRLRKELFDRVLLTSELPTGRYNDRSLENLLSSSESALLFSYAKFYNTDDLAFSIFDPIPALKAKSDETVSTFPNNTIGVHIRRTDNQKAIEHSPTDEFVKAMDKEIEINPNTHFFLATDCQETVDNLKERFRDRIISRQRALSRATTKGGQDALVDLYCLSKTSKLFGSCWSSFSTTAAEIGSIKEVKMKKPSKFKN